MNFPEIIENQVVVMRADASTGVILDENLNVVKSGSSQKVYTVVESYDQAINLVETVLRQNANIEFVIYGPDQKVLNYINPFKK